MAIVIIGVKVKYYLKAKANNKTFGTVIEGLGRRNGWNNSFNGIENKN